MQKEDLGTSLGRAYRKLATSTAITRPLSKLRMTKHKHQVS
jgi:hypothetical protein